MIQTIPLVQVPDQGQNRFNSSVKTSVDQLSKIPFLNGNFLQSIVLSTGQNTVNHGLGRAYISYFLGKTNAQVVPYDTTPSSMDKTQSLQLTASAPVTIDLWVF